MRRSRREIQLGRLLTIGQDWRCRDDGAVWTVAQVYRADCQVLLHRWIDYPGVAPLARDNEFQIVAFSVLRTHWKWIATNPRQEAA